MASWGDINATLNRMVREGAIAGFRTNRAEKSQDAALHVTVTPSPGDDLDSVHKRIMSVLVPLDDEVTVTVGAASPSNAA